MIAPNVHFGSLKCTCGHKVLLFYGSLDWKVKDATCSKCGRVYIVKTTAAGIDAQPKKAEEEC